MEDIFLFPATSLGKREVTLLSRKPRGICKVTPNEFNSWDHPILHYGWRLYFRCRNQKDSRANNNLTNLAVYFCPAKIEWPRLHTCNNIKFDWLLLKPSVCPEISHNYANAFRVYRLGFSIAFMNENFRSLMRLFVLAIKAIAVRFLTKRFIGEYDSSQGMFLRLLDRKFFNTSLVEWKMSLVR